MGFDSPAADVSKLLIVSAGRLLRHASASVPDGAEAGLPMLRRRRRRLQVHGVRPAAVQAGWHVVRQVQRAHRTCSRKTATNERPVNPATPLETAVHETAMLEDKL